MQKYPAPNKLKLTLPGTQCKMTRHAKRQENMTHNGEKNQSVGINTEWIQTLELQGRVKVIITVKYRFKKLRHGGYKRYPNRTFRDENYDV